MDIICSTCNTYLSNIQEMWMESFTIHSTHLVVIAFITNNTANSNIIHQLSNKAIISTNWTSNYMIDWCLTQTLSVFQLYIVRSNYNTCSSCSNPKIIYDLDKYNLIFALNSNLSVYRMTVKLYLKT